MRWANFDLLFRRGSVKHDACGNMSGPPKADFSGRAVLSDPKVYKRSPTERHASKVDP